MPIYDEFSKKCHAISKNILLPFGKFLNCLVCVASFKSMSSLSRKKYDGDNILPYPVSDYEVKIRRWK